MILKYVIPFLAAGIFCIYAVQISAETNFLADRHAKNQGLACEDCHEGVKKPEKKAGIKACLDCHGGFKGMAEQTKALEKNPHDSHEGGIDCNECHKPHKQSVDYCEQCHAFGFIVP